MHCASRRALHARARFSSRAWRESRYALRGVGGCGYGCARCRTPHQPALARCAFVQKLLRQAPANSHRRLTGRAGRVATAGIADPNPRRLPASASAATAAIFPRDAACSAQRKCSPRLLANPWHPRQYEPACAFGAANRAADGLVVEGLRKTIEGGEVAYPHQPQHLAQFAMLSSVPLLQEGSSLPNACGTEWPATAVG